MRPIQDIAELKPGHVLFHSAFGFARIYEIGPSDVRVSWGATDQNLPRKVTRDTLRRVYSLCRPGGFFEKRMLDPDALDSLLASRPLDALELLLQDLAGPQSPADIREWLVTLNLLADPDFERWWKRLERRILRDARFQSTGGLLGLRNPHGIVNPLNQLDDPVLAPAKRLDLALELREQLGQDIFRDQVVLAWKSGGSQVKDLAMRALQGHHPQRVLIALLSDHTPNAEALIHALRRAKWEPTLMDEEVLTQLLDRVRHGARDPATVDSEARLAATVCRWWPEGGRELLVSLTHEPDGQRLVRAAIEALPQRRAESLHLSVMEHALSQEDEQAAGWLTWLLLELHEEPTNELAQRVAGLYPRCAKHLFERFVVESQPFEEDDEEEDTSMVTLEMELDPFGEDGTMQLGDLPVRSGQMLVTLACAVARSLAEAHEAGHVVNPTGKSYVLHLDGRVELKLDRGDEHASPRVPGEPPSKQGDIYATAVLLLEAMLGRMWPRHISADRVLPYLRHLVRDLPPSAMAPFDHALHPDAQSRPASADKWLATWNMVAQAESQRALANHAMPARLDIGYDTHVGHMKILQSQTNQDALSVASRGTAHLLCVCDGISTANAGSGDVASGITSHVISNLWEQHFSRLKNADDLAAEAFLERALGMANRAVCEAALRYAGGDLAGRVPMGTTAVVAFVRGSRVQLGWLGDSRAYLVGPYGASLLTADMNQAGERLRMWHRGDDMSWDPSGYALVGYIGHFNEDLRPEGLIPRQASLTLLPGERLVLCTDGITDYISLHHPGAADVIAGATWGLSAIDAANTLIHVANRGGGGDNCTVIVAMIPHAADDLGSPTGG